MVTLLHLQLLMTDIEENDCRLVSTVSSPFGQSAFNYCFWLKQSGGAGTVVHVRFLLPNPEAPDSFPSLVEG